MPTLQGAFRPVQLENGNWSSAVLVAMQGKGREKTKKESQNPGRVVSTARVQVETGKGRELPQKLASCVPELPPQSGLGTPDVAHGPYPASSLRTGARSNPARLCPFGTKV
jgi:hypothetical protein